MIPASSPHKNWFTETFELEKGRAVSIAVKEKTEDYRSAFQHIQVFDTVPFGKMLVLDGVIMLTEADNFAYHEMISHVPMMSHPNPENVLIVGGGDGGTLKEILKYKSVKNVSVCEIDKEVINVSQKHFPQLASSFDDSRVEIMIEDAAKFIKKHKDQFDVICVDSSDPVGPAEILFKKPFYKNLSDALSENGIAVSQSESLYYHKTFIKNLISRNKTIFSHTAYYYTMIPTYPSGTIGFSFCSNKIKPQSIYDPQRMNHIKPLKYYNTAIHKSAFILPEFIKEVNERNS